MYQIFAGIIALGGGFVCLILIGLKLPWLEKLWSVGFIGAWTWFFGRYALTGEDPFPPRTEEEYAQEHDQESEN